MRLLSYLVLLGVGTLLVPMVAAAGKQLLWLTWCWLLNTIAPPLVSLAFLSIILGLFVGEKGRERIGKVWFGAFQLMLQFLGILLKLLVRLASRHDKG